MLTFYKIFKNRRKLDDFSGSNDFDGKNTHVKNNFTNFKYRTLMRIGHICLTTCFSLEFKKLLTKNWAPRRQPQLSQICKENWLLFRNRKFFFSIFCQIIFYGILSYFITIESKSLRSYKLVWGGGKSP